MSLSVGFLSRALVLVVLGAACSACSSEGAVGEACDEVGRQLDQCESDAICGYEKAGGELVCLAICYAQTDCGADQECNGVEGSEFKACRTKY
jgi:hypothetical protein